MSRRPVRKTKFEQAVFEIETALVLVGDLKVERKYTYRTATPFAEIFVQGKNGNVRKKRKVCKLYLSDDFEDVIADVYDRSFEEPVVNIAKRYGREIHARMAKIYQPSVAKYVHYILEMKVDDDFDEIA